MILTNQVPVGLAGLRSVGYLMRHAISRGDRPNEQLLAALAKVSCAGRDQDITGCHRQRKIKVCC